MIQVEHVSRSYGAIQALADVSLQVKSGEIVGLLGPNGAGKTTLIKILTGYLQPDEGFVSIDGLDVLTHRREVQSRIGYLPENAPLYPELSVQQYLQMIADLREVPTADVRARLADAIRATNLVDRLTQPIGTLSKGFRQRVGLAQAILHRPRLLILDEPSIGLDPTQIVEMRNLIRRLSEQSTILFSSHVLSEVEALCSRAVIIFNGRVRADVWLADLAESQGAQLVLATSAAAEGPALARQVRAELQRLPGVVEVRELDPGGAASAAARTTLQITGDSGFDLIPAIFAAAAQKGWPVRELRPLHQTLESLFNRLATEDE